MNRVPQVEVVIDYVIQIASQWVRGYEEFVPGQGQLRISAEPTEPGQLRIMLSSIGLGASELASFDLRLVDVLTNQSALPVERNAGELRNMVDELTEHLQIAQERVAQLQRRQARHLEGLEYQGVLLARLSEYIEGKDVVRTNEIQTILEELSR